MGSCFSKPKPPIDDGPPTLKKFELMRSIGRGTFGKVRIVRYKGDRQLFALKYISKEKCILQNAVKNTIMERNLLEDLEHPFMTNLRYAFQDDSNIFMVLDLMLGGDMRFMMRTRGTALPESWVKYYATEMISGIDYLHKNGIIHRDIKLDNLLLDSEGHVHLTDFNVATYLPPDGQQLKSFAGTLSYMAPEMIARAGYCHEVDWWSMGVVLFEILFGRKPFRGKTRKHIAGKILKCDFKFPDTSREISEECYDFISGLLTLKAKDRLGFGPDGGDTIRSHPWFADVDWVVVDRKDVKPPFTPHSNRVNFDAIYEAEDVLMEDSPLGRRTHTHVDHSNPYHQFILREFYDFDYKKRMPLEMRISLRHKLVQKALRIEQRRAERTLSIYGIGSVTTTNTTSDRSNGLDEVWPLEEPPEEE